MSLPSSPRQHCELGLASKQTGRFGTNYDITSLMGSFAQGVAFRSFQNPNMPTLERRLAFLHWVEVFATFAIRMGLIFVVNMTLIILNIYLGPPASITRAQGAGSGASPWLWAAALICSMGHPYPREVTKALMKISATKGGYEDYSAEKVDYFLREYRKVNLQHLFLTDGPSWVFSVLAVTKNLGVCWTCHAETVPIALGAVGLTVVCYVSLRGVLRAKS